MMLGISLSVAACLLMFSLYLIIKSAHVPCSDLFCASWILVTTAMCIFFLSDKSLSSGELEITTQPILESLLNTAAKIALGVGIFGFIGWLVSCGIEESKKGE